MHLLSSSKKPHKQMHIVSSASLSTLSRFHRVLSLLLASLDVDWNDLRMNRGWSQHQVKRYLSKTVEIKQTKLRSVPIFATNLLMDQTDHPTYGFSKRLVPVIQDVFCRCHKHGWNHKTLLAASAMIVFATHFPHSVSYSKDTCSKKVDHVGDSILSTTPTLREPPCVQLVSCK